MTDNVGRVAGKITATLFCIGVLLSSVFAGLDAMQSKAPPGGMQLLPGYRHEARQGIDTALGRIWREGGPELLYEIGLNARNEFVEQQRDGSLLWVKTIRRAGTTLELGMGKDQRSIAATINGSSHCFVAQNVVSREDLADVLLMLTTYEPLSPGRAH